MSSVPTAAHYVVIGAGVHGLSTSMHLAQRLRAAGKTVGAGGHAHRRRSTRPASAPARPASRAASSATTTTSRRCAS